MLNDRIAESLLEAVTTRERAASTVGDLRETASVRGEVWFWWSLLATCASLTLRSLADDPRGLGKLAFKAWLLSLGLCLAFVLGGILLMGLAIGLNDRQGAWGGGFTGLQAMAFLVAVVSLIRFRVGRWIARRAPGRELPVCLAFTILQSTIEYSIVLAFSRTAGDAVALSLNLLTHAFCFLGAIASRHRLAPAKRV